MAIKLPEAFLNKMRELLGEQFEAFLASYDEERYYGLRSNPLKLSPDELAELGLFHLAPVPWAKEGFYYEEGERPGKHPYYHAGLYYIQEPSAMVPAELLDVQPGDKVLDLCAAPGGKTTQLAGKLGGSGIIVANDNNADRVRVLARNVELFGIRNALVMNETPDRLAARWPGAFNKILIDAPCSGEGMFRKEEDMVRQWEKHSVEKCALMQKDILHHAASLLAPGGRIVYSTCTFSPEENECSIAGFLRDHPEFHVLPIEPAYGFEPGRPDWAAQAEGSSVPDTAALETSGTIRLWPHRIKGEGHYAAVLVKDKDSEASDAEKPDTLAAAVPARSKERPGKDSRSRKQPSRLPEAPNTGPWLEFQSEHLKTQLPGTPVFFGEQLYLTPYGSPPVEGLKSARPGWFIGTVKRGRFEPSHALAIGLFPSELKRTLTLPAASEQLLRYLKGETLFIEENEISRDANTQTKGYVLVCAGPYPVGWGKWAGGMLKNEYPPAWRWV